MNNNRCETCKKVQFKNQESAEKRAEEINKKEGQKILRAYECQRKVGTCMYWCLTGQTNKYHNQKMERLLKRKQKARNKFINNETQKREKKLGISKELSSAINGIEENINYKSKRKKKSKKKKKIQERIAKNNKK